jgi:hypothetical protein
MIDDFEIENGQNPNLNGEPCFETEAPGGVMIEYYIGTAAAQRLNADLFFHGLTIGPPTHIDNIIAGIGGFTIHEAFITDSQNPKLTSGKIDLHRDIPETTQATDTSSPLGFGYRLMGYIRINQPVELKAFRNYEKVVKEDIIASQTSNRTAKIMLGETVREALGELRDQQIDIGPLDDSQKKTIKELFEQAEALNSTTKDIIISFYHLAVNLIKELFNKTRKNN